ncbi:hypothetical protein BS17DRAFT_769175 [Gyrodon lividus]|nr:hypothetical protein BS17DRAFT_769175 [Gyrodon lividus]
MIVEYPQTGAREGQAVAHIFMIDPATFNHPELSFQYSMGNNHGGHCEVKCDLLCNNTGKTFLCNHLKSSCRGLKVCSARLSSNLGFPHSYMSHFNVQELIMQSFSYIDTAKAEVFMKMLALLCALNGHGFSFIASSGLSSAVVDYIITSNYLGLDINAHIGLDLDLDSDSDFEMDMGSLPASILDGQHCSSWRCQPQTNMACKGRLVMWRDNFNRFFIWHFWRTIHMPLQHMNLLWSSVDMGHYFCAISWHHSQNKSRFVIGSKLAQGNLIPWANGLDRTSVGTCQKCSEDAHHAQDCKTAANKPKSATVAKPHNTTCHKPECDMRRQGRVEKRGRGGKEEAGGTGKEEAVARRSGEDTMDVLTASVGLAVTPNSQNVDGKDPRVYHRRANPQKPIASHQTVSPVASEATADAMNPNAASAGPSHGSI